MKSFECLTKNNAFAFSTGRDVHTAHRPGGAGAAKESANQFTAIAESATDMESTLCWQQSHRAVSHLLQADLR